MQIEPEDIPAVGMLLAAYLSRSIGEFNATRGVEVSNGVVLHASTALYARALATIMRANPPELANTLLETWISNLRARVDEELDDEELHSE
jgi:hypothetical protein